MDTGILPERELKVRHVEDRVVSVDHEHFIFSVDQHHVPAGGQNVPLCNYKVHSCICAGHCAREILHGLLPASNTASTVICQYVRRQWNTAAPEHNGCRLALFL